MVDMRANMMENYGIRIEQVKWAIVSFFRSLCSGSFSLQAKAYGRKISIESKIRKILHLLTSGDLTLDLRLRSDQSSFEVVLF